MNHLHPMASTCSQLLKQCQAYVFIVLCKNCITFTALLVFPCFFTSLFDTSIRPWKFVGLHCKSRYKQHRGYPKIIYLLYRWCMKDLGQLLQILCKVTNKPCDSWAYMTHVMRKQILRSLSLSYQKKSVVAPILLLVWHRLFRIWVCWHHK